MSRPTLSLCMIVKNEAELLPDFLRGVEGLWDELVVVDTGSDDDTVEILTSAGATVIHRAWDDDFSAARNASLDAAGGDWILVLDPDEQVSEVLVREIRELIADCAVGAATIVIRNQLQHGNVRESDVLRLHRRHPNVRYRYPIHEDAGWSVNTRLRQTRQRCVRLTGWVDHSGYIKSRAIAKGKKARDLGIMRRCMADYPDDLYIPFKMLSLAAYWEDSELLTSTAEEVLPKLELAAPEVVRSAHFAGEMITLLLRGLHRDQPTAGLIFLNCWIPKIGPSAACYLRRAEIREKRGDIEGARADFERCLDMDGQTANRQMATVRPLLGLARLALAQGDLPEAGHRANAALDLNAQDPEAVMAVGLVRWYGGGTNALRAFADDYLSNHKHPAIIHSILGELASQLGQHDFAVEQYEQAVKTEPDRATQLNLARELMSAGRLDACRELARSIVQDVPEAALGVLVCDLAQARDTDLSINLELEAANTALKGWVLSLAKGGRRDELETFANCAEAVAEVFPWLPAASRELVL